MEKKSIGKVKMTLTSGEGMKSILEESKQVLGQIKHMADKMEEKENRSMMRALWIGLTKKPVIGKPRGKNAPISSE